ncbi:hypothetical protein V6N13_021893 [Hibiscus sabdariffa]
MVTLAKCEPRNQFWQRKRRVSNLGMVFSGKMWGKCRRLRPVMCVAWKVGGGEEYLQILQHCSIGWCQVLISNSSLVDEMRLEKVSGVHVMRISRPLVLLIFDSIEIQQQVVSSDVLKIWFSRVVDWNETDCALDYCRVWVPVHVWSLDNFERFVSH